MRRFFTILPLAVTTLGFATHAAAGKRVTTEFQMPVRVHATVETSDCSNATGSQITFAGELALGGLGVDLIFTNNEKGTHTYEDATVVSQSLVQAGETMQIPKQPSQGGVGGNPFCWIQFVEPSGRALTDEIFLGRCVEGRFSAASELALPVTATAVISATDCSNNPGPYITLDGGMTLSGLNCKMIFRNNDNPVGGPHNAEDEVAINMAILPAGQEIRFPKQPVLGGVGGNPWIHLQFNDGNGSALGSESLLGRCVQLSK